ncbi:transcription factor adf-1 [Plakobranchus ocellatus]|uniref:Transcription factor adf-1 n=1 Tax=Plakobranchus ocellatus TaxID=259542 RepID=A0AAV3YY99_9GAST|nr:transcription factor adf-1 [Plakobranchus ocellatus]
MITKSIGINLSLISDSTLRKKWKNLRDYFGTGDGAEESTQTSKWQYYQQMLFLKDIVAPRRCQSSLDSIVSDVDSQSHNQFTILEPAPESNNEHYDIPASSSAASPSECQLGPSPTPQARGKKRKSTAGPGVLYQQKLLDLEEKKLELSTQRNEKNDESDDDLLFLKSLLPYIKRIPAERKLSFRSGIQRVVEDFAFGGQHTSDFRVSNTEMYQQQTPLPSIFFTILRCKMSTRSFRVLVHLKSM